MMRQIVPVFLTMNIPGTMAYYQAKLGFQCLGTWQIHFRCAEPPTANPNKYSDELIDAYLFVEDADQLYAEYGARGVEFIRGPANIALARA